MHFCICWDRNILLRFGKACNQHCLHIPSCMGCMTLVLFLNLQPRMPMCVMSGCPYGELWEVF